MLSEHEHAYWQEALISSYQEIAASPSIATPCSDKPTGTVYGSRILITQRVLESSRMLRVIPRLPLQNAMWLQFAYSPSMPRDLYDELANHFHISHRTQKKSAHAAHKALVLAALLHERLFLQPNGLIDAIPWQVLKTITNTNANTATEWRKSRWYNEWLKLRRCINKLDAESIDMLLQLRRSIRDAQEGPCQH